MKALVVIRICTGDLPREACTPETARAVISGRAESLVCGAGVIAGTAGPAGVDQTEYARIICKMR